MRLPLMPDAGESCHVSRHGSSNVVSVFGMVGAHVWCGVKLPYSSSTYHTLSKGRGRGDEQVERKPILKDDGQGSRNLARLLSTSLAAKSSVSASA